MKLTCEICSRPFDVRPYRVKTARFCSPKCKAIGNRRVVTARDVEQEFWSRVKKGSPTECWPWTGTIMATGYGLLRIGAGFQATAHRISYGLANGDIPGMLGARRAVVRHACDNRRCVNPGHLLIGTQGDNVMDAYQRGTQPHPPKLTDDDIRAIRVAGGMYKDIAAAFGVDPSLVSRIKTRARYKNIP